MKQTAVEFFIEQLEGDDSKIARIIGLKRYNSIVNQAKEMEKEQRQQDTNHGYAQGYDDGVEGKEPMRPELLDIKTK